LNKTKVYTKWRQLF